MFEQTVKKDVCSVFSVKNAALCHKENALKEVNALKSFLPQLSENSFRNAGELQSPINVS